MGKKHKPEEIIGKLREAEIVLALAGPVHDWLRYRRVHRAFVWGTEIVFLAQPAHTLLAASAPVQAIVAQLAPAGMR